MIHLQVENVIEKCFQAGLEEGLWSSAGAGKFTVELPKREGQGDFATNFALVLAGIEKTNPRETANLLVKKLETYDELIAKIEIAGPGFINITVQPAVWQHCIPVIMQKGNTFGYSTIGNKRKVMVEFVSANPTGPLSIGHGRQAILGDSIARLLEATGHDVYREYYYNNAGRQMRVLGESTKARYLELLGKDFSFPEDGYQGEYIKEIAQSLIDKQGDALSTESDIEPFRKQAEKFIFNDIAGTLKRMGITFDNYFNEQSLYDDGHIADVVSQLRAKGLVYEHDGATWFKTSELGQEQDRVIIKSSGEPTYRLPDIAYHREKFKRNFDWLIDIFGSDHIATVPDVLSGVEALGYNPDKVTVVLHQFVTLTRDGKQVKMSTRKANFITVDELLDEVGVDPVRFFFMMRKADSQMEFDLALATKESQENPVYYVQYAHARLCAIMRQAREKGLAIPSVTQCSDINMSLLTTPEELKLLKVLSMFPKSVERSALELAPHRMIVALSELAALLHSYYNKHKVLSSNTDLTNARLYLIAAVQIVLRNGLQIAGLSAPERM